MNRTLLAALFGALGCVGGANPAQAHHSFAMFDRERTVTVSGTVRAFSWANPHSFVWVDVVRSDGGTDTWAIEFASGPVNLARKGWKKDTLKTGDQISVDLNPLRDGRLGGALKRAHLPDGRVLDEEIDIPADAAKQPGAGGAP